jgi:glycosyltransferase involved in cell wall biosynthesis
MPVWNPRTEWLEASVRAALGQVGCDIELIVVDDGNPVPIAQVLGEIDDARLHVIRSEHGGAAAARNLGIEKAAGRYLRFIDADDVVTLDGTRRLLDRADDRTISYGSTEVCDEALRPLRRLEAEVEGDAVRACLFAQFDVRHVSMLFPASAVRAAGSWDPEITICEDWDFVLRCVEQAPVARVPDVVTRYRRHARSVTRADRAWLEWRHGQRRVIEKYLDRHPELPVADRRSIRASSYRAAAARALDEHALGPFVHDTLALAGLRPRDAARMWAGALRRLRRRARRPRA